jgi:hypothetical protein
MGVVRSLHAPAALPPIKWPDMLYVGWPQARSGYVRKISLPPGFDSQTVQPVVSRYTDWAIAAHYYSPIRMILYVINFSPLTALLNTPFNIKCNSKVYTESLKMVKGWWIHITWGFVITERIGVLKLPSQTCLENARRLAQRIKPFVFTQL